MFDTEPGDIPDDQEIPGQVEFGDYAKFVFDLIDDLFGKLAVAVFSAKVGPVSKETPGAVTFGDGKLGERGR